MIAPTFPVLMRWVSEQGTAPQTRCWGGKLQEVAKSYLGKEYG